MRNIYLTALVMSAMFMSASCSLDEVSYLTDESHVTDAYTAESLLLGVYEKLGTDGIYRNNLPFIFNLPNDESKTSGEGLTAQRTDMSNAFTASSSYVQLTWQSLYAAIYYANYFIDVVERKSPSFSEKDRQLCEYYIAEACALRALLYFELVRWYGNVPLVLSPDESYRKPEEFRQAAPTEVYAQIEKDLKYAIGVLPYAGEDKVRKDNSFRISKGGALGLLTKVYATWAGYPLKDESKWEQAALTAQTLIDSGHHGLLKDFQQLWHNSGSNTWDPTESLWEISYWSPLSTFESCGRVGMVNGVRATQGGLRGGNHTHQVMYNFHPTFLTKWKDYDKDLRFGLTYADYSYKKDGKSCITKKNSEDVPFLRAWLGKETDPKWQENWRFEASYLLTNRKWDTEMYVPDYNNQVNSNYSNVNWYLLRYADVLLLYAEALNEWKKAPDADAFEAVNMVRRRGFGLDVNTPSSVADLPSDLDYAGFQQAIRDERSWELAAEGHRRQDLVRWGIYYEAVMDTYNSLADWYKNAQRYFIGGEYTQKNKHELLPIPQREIDLCGYRQNNGWY